MPVADADPADHEVLLALGDELPIGIWVARAPNGELVYANRAFSEILGMGARDDVTVGGYAVPYGIYGRDGALYPEERMPFVRALAERRPVVVDDITIRRHDGSQIEIRAVARPVGNPVTHVVVAFTDITRERVAERGRAEAEQHLRRAQRLESVGALAGGMAHEFNNLMFGVKLLATEVAANDTDPKRREAMAAIDDITERSATLTRSLLGFARRGKHRTIAIGLNDAVAALSELFSRTLPGIALTFELEASERGTVSADVSQLEQLVTALVLHARDAVRGSGRVVVRTSDRVGDRGTRQVVLEVKDDGAGLAPELGTPAAAAGGPEAAGGPGLAPVFELVDQLRGQLEIDVGLDGRGTTVRIALPAASRPAVRPRPTVAELPKGSGTLLLVDDDPMVRKVVTGSLGVLGYDTIEAVSGTEAIEIYRARHREIRAVVLDMMMPGMTGKTAYLALREIEPSVIVLLMSGHTLNDEIQELLDLGVRSFVSKPYSIAVLAKAMSELLPS